MDYNTTGLLIGVKNYQTYREMSHALKNDFVEKHYKSLVHGIVKFKERTIKCNLLKKSNMVEVVEKGTPNSKESITEVKLLRHFFEKNMSLVSLRLITGRTHQIRAHMSWIGHPVRGDQKYGAEKSKKEYPYPALVAYKLKFSRDIPGETLKDLRDRVFEKKDSWFDHLAS